MQEFLTKQTVQDLGIPSTRHLWIDAQELWKELDKGNEQSDIVGKSITKAAIIANNRRFKFREESYLEQDLMVSEVIAQLFEKLIVNGALYNAFPSLDDGKRERQFVAYILRAASRELINIVMKKVRREEIAEFDSIEEKTEKSEEDGGSADSAWEELSNNVNTQLTDPEERAAIVDRLREIIEDTEYKKKRIKNAAKELLENMDERVVIANNHFGFMSFKNPAQFLKKLPDYEVLDEYLFYEVKKATQIDKQYFPQKDHETIDELNENLDKLMKEFGDKGEKFKSKAAAALGEDGAKEEVRVDTLVGVPLFKDVDLRFFDETSAKLSRDYYIALDIDVNLEQIIDTLMIQDFKKVYYQRVEEES